MICLFKDKSECCGCSACAAVCPHNAIAMKADTNGFLYPEINGDLCVECGLCQKVCAFKNGYQALDYQKKVYAAKNKSSAARQGSSSGGAFPLIAEKFIEDGGVVFGAAFDSELKLRHIAAHTKQELVPIYKSKYLQSDLGDTFKEIKELLDSGKPCLFSGTGCQVQGLREFLRKDYHNLFTVDIVCHGVASPKIFEDYKKMMSERFSSKIKSIDFRAKKIYGQTQDMQVVFENSKSYCEFPDIDVYKILYSNNLSIRSSCFECKFANTDRTGDITLGDFWASRSIGGFDDKKGVSLVMINSEKGEKLFSQINSELSEVEVELEKALQPNLKAPTKKPDAYERFQCEYADKGFEYVCKKYARRSLKYKAVRRAKTAVKRLLKRK